MSTVAINNIIEAIRRGRQSEAAFFGIIGSDLLVFDISGAMQTYADSLRKSVDELTKDEQRVAIFNHAIEKTEALYSAERRAE